MVGLDWLLNILSQRLPLISHPANVQAQPSFGSGLCWALSDSRLLTFSTRCSADPVSSDDTPRQIGEGLHLEEPRGECALMSWSSLAQVTGRTGFQKSHNLAKRESEYVLPQF